MSVPSTPLQMLAQPSRVSSIKFRSSNSEARNSLHTSSCQSKKSYTGLFYVMLAQFRCIVLKPGRQHVSTHGYTVMEQPVARDLFQKLPDSCLLNNSRAAITHSARILPLPTQAKRELSTTNSTKDKFWLQTRSQSLVPKMKQVLASPNETIEAAFQKLKLKMASVKRNTNGPNEKKYRGAKKRFPNECAQQPFYRCSHNRAVCLA